MDKIALAIQLFCAAFWFNGQTANVSILVNGNFIESGFSRFYLAVAGSNNKAVAIDYIPGELLLGISGKELLDTENNTKFELSFNYTTQRKGRLETINYIVPITKHQLVSRYAIINVYDFRDKRYKKWYGPHKKDAVYLSEVWTHHGGRLIRYE